MSHKEIPNINSLREMLLLLNYKSLFSLRQKTLVFSKKRQGRCFCRLEIQEFTLVNDCISRQENEEIGVFLQTLFRVSAYLLFVSVLLFSSCVREEMPQDFSISSNLELLSKNKKFFLANNDSSYKFKGGAQQTALISRSGSNSVYSSPKNAFTLSINFPHIYRDSYVDVSIWKKGKEAHLVCILEGTKQYFTTNNELKEKVFEFIINKPFNILEPCIGQGDLITFITNKTPTITFDMYEIDANIKLLDNIQQNLSYLKHVDDILLLL
jgi:hypothetical protein